MVQPGTRHYRHGDDPFAVLCRRVEPFQAKLATHFIYTRVRNQLGLQVFMANHVFAVWDFMTLVKVLQQRLTCVTTPWLPPPNPLAARLVNEIVLGEESDELGEGRYRSHYEIYLSAMAEIGANDSAIQNFEQSLRAGTDPEAALEPLRVADATKGFVTSTLQAATGKTHEVAASLLLAREDLIPVMFDRVLREMDSREEIGEKVVRGLRNLGTRMPPPLRSALKRGLKGATDDQQQRRDDPRFNFRFYLARHVALDGEEHGPMGRRLLISLCGDDQDMWDEATLAARAALEARIALWDGVLLEIEAAEAEARGDNPGSLDAWPGRDHYRKTDDTR